MALAQALPPISSREAQAPSLHRALPEKVGKPGLAKSSIPLQKKAPRYLLDTGRLGQAAQCLIWFDGAVTARASSPLQLWASHSLLPRSA